MYATTIASPPLLSCYLASTEGGILSTSLWDGGVQLLQGLSQENDSLSVVLILLLHLLVGLSGCVKDTLELRYFLSHGLSQFGRGLAVPFLLEAVMERSVLTLLLIKYTLSLCVCNGGNQLIKCKLMEAHSIAHARGNLLHPSASPLTNTLTHNLLPQTSHRHTHLIQYLPIGLQQVW